MISRCMSIGIIDGLKIVNIKGDSHTWLLRIGFQVLFYLLIKTGPVIYSCQRIHHRHLF